ncbi:FRIGIDA-like protein 4a [Cocos nucifera]|uniref:FRIGIDA-like protein n=1 Tax=Cocos nucifera TaxID=13894 RepID=A0A8K0IDJ4_COCNU|nr:FRIGIDA-like protein 4a [Cocos nucifera]
MGSAAAAISSSLVQESFEELERQRELITSCTILWKELSDHFSSMERDLQLWSESLRSKRQSLDLSTQRSLDSLHRRELSIDSAVDLALAKVEVRRDAALLALSSPASPLDNNNDTNDLPGKLRSFCTRMDSDAFWDLVVSKRKEVELLRSELPLALADCIDPAKFVMDAISKVFPIDRRAAAAAAAKSPNDFGWACVLILESVVPVLADPELGTARPLVTRSVRERARGMADAWKECLEQRGGVESAKPPDAHTFLQHVVTFGIAAKEDREFYRRLVVSFAWRRQMPRLAVFLGLEDRMADIIEELISKGQQLDAINFAYEAGLQDKFPPVPLLKSFLKDSKKATSSSSEDRNNSGQAVNNGSRKEQSALRSVMKCIEDRKLEAEFPLEGLQKRLENLEKAKVEKKKPSGGGPANKRTRANNGGPMPPAKAGRLTNNAYVSSFPATTAFVRSPSAHAAHPAAAPPYPYDRPAGHGVYGSRSPPAIRDPYAYPTEEVAPAALGASYPSAPMNYPAYCAYNNGLAGYNNGLAPGYQQAYYR